VTHTSAYTWLPHTNSEKPKQSQDAQGALTKQCKCQPKEPAVVTQLNGTLALQLCCCILVLLLLLLQVAFYATPATLNVQCYSRYFGLVDWELILLVLSAAAAAAAAAACFGATVSAIFAVLGGSQGPH
jgi:hypothetical protein